MLGRSHGTSETTVRGSRGGANVAQCLRSGYAAARITPVACIILPPLGQDGGTATGATSITNVKNRCKREGHAQPARQALHQQPDRAVGRAEQPVDHGRRADRVQVVRRGLFQLRVARGHQADDARADGSIVHQLDRARLADGERHRTQTGNVSRGGLSFSLATPARLPFTIELVLVLPDGRRITMESEVRHVARREGSSEFDVGVQFVEPHRPNTATKARIEPTSVGRRRSA